jgi:hypothetical protein
MEFSIRMLVVIVLIVIVFLVLASIMISSGGSAGDMIKGIFGSLDQFWRTPTVK